MKISIIQNNPKTDDFERNLSALRKAVAEADRQGADIIVAPEYAVTGPNPEDLLLREKFFIEAENAVRQLASLNVRAAIVAGTIIKEGDCVYNTAAVIDGGRLEFVKKSILSHDEAYYMDAGEKEGFCTIRGKNVLITLGGEVKLDYLFAEKPDLAINISAGTYTRGRITRDLKELSVTAKKHGVMLVSANLCGGNDENVYYGASAVFAPDGKVLAEAGAFEEAVINIDTDKVEPSVIEERDDTADLVAALTLGLGDYFCKQNFGKAVIGLSGGIDSAVVAALAARAIGGENVLGVMMPSEYTSDESISGARELAENLKMPYRIVPVKNIFNSLVNEIKPATAPGSVSLTLQNLQSRSRGVILMALSNEENRLVLATGNKSEVAMGYCTLYGDTVGAIDPLADLFKTEVYEIARYLNKRKEIIPEETITRAPSAELRPGQKDEDELPPYEKLDKIVRLYLEENKSAEELVEAGFDSNMVEKAIRRIEINEYKRRQLPMGIKISECSFFIDRKMPIVRKPL